MSLCGMTIATPGASKTQQFLRGNMNSSSDLRSAMITLKQEAHKACNARAMRIRDPGTDDFPYLEIGC